MIAQETPPVGPAFPVDWSLISDSIGAQITSVLPVVLPIAGGILSVFVGWHLIRRLLTDELEGATPYERAALLSGEAENAEEIEELNRMYGD